MADGSLTEPQRAWVAALRSGEYQQTDAVLTRLDEDGGVVGHCCLGVACDIAVKAGIVEDLGPEEHEGYDCRKYGTENEAEWTFLPLPVRDWLGLVDSSGAMDDGESLAGRNDAFQTFERIADIIESRPDGLFEEAS